MKLVNIKKSKIQRGYIMKRLFYVAFIILIAFSVSGCCGKLKEENANLSNELAQLQQDKDSCNKALAVAKNDIAARDKALQVKAKEIQTKEVQVKEQSAAFAQMQEAMKAELASKEVTLKELEGKLTLTMVEAILFDSGRAVDEDKVEVWLEFCTNRLYLFSGYIILISGLGRRQQEKGGETFVLHQSLF